MKEFKQGKISMHNMDCMEYMRDLQNNAFDLAIVDPPYGMEKGQATSRIKKYGQLETVNQYKPSKKYFSEVFRVSKNQIIWGYNHLSDMLPSCREFIFWYKHQPVPTYSDGELAWTSFQKTAKCFDFPFFGSTGSDKHRIHPTQKPVKLYQWILKNYANPSHSILDTHMGSASCAVAAHYFGCKFVGTEISDIYFTESVQRVINETSQQALF